MNRKVSRIIILFLSMMLVLTPVLSACSKTADSPDTYLVYYTNADHDDLVHTKHQISQALTKDLYSKVSELLYQMFSVDQTEEGLYSTKPENVIINDYVIDNYGLLSVDFSSDYYQLTNVQEIVLRSSLVLTVIQVDGIYGIEFTVDGKPALDSKGGQIGVMTAELFTDILLNEEGMLKQEADVTLLFANAEGNGLVPVVSHFTISNNNMSMEEYILVQLIKGPEANSGAYPTIASNVELINVVTSEEVCYVNFGSSFLDQEQPVGDEILLYSIVNSLCRLTYVNSVQILIDGETVDNKLHTVTDISKPITRDLTLESQK